MPPGRPELFPNIADSDPFAADVIKVGNELHQILQTLPGTGANLNPEVVKLMSDRANILIRRPDNEKTDSNDNLIYGIFLNKGKQTGIRFRVIPGISKISIEIMRNIGAHQLDMTINMDSDFNLTGGTVGIQLTNSNTLNDIATMDAENLRAPINAS